MVEEGVRFEWVDVLDECWVYRGAFLVGRCYGAVRGWVFDAGKQPFAPCTAAELRAIAAELERLAGEMS